MTPNPWLPQPAAKTKLKLHMHALGQTQQQQLTKGRKFRVRSQTEYCSLHKEGSEEDGLWGWNVDSIGDFLQGFLPTSVALERGIRSASWLQLFCLPCYYLDPSCASTMPCKNHLQASLPTMPWECRLTVTRSFRRERERRNEGFPHQQHWHLRAYHSERREEERGQKIKGKFYTNNY